jgi:hypothetical protein
MTHNEFTENARKWGIDRGIYTQSTALDQSKKYLEEEEELEDAIKASDLPEIEDALGDIVVCAVHQFVFTGKFDEFSSLSEFGLVTTNSTMEALDLLRTQYEYQIYRPIDTFICINEIADAYDVDLEKAYQNCWNEIKDRTGRFVDGVFVKDLTK